MLVIPLPVLASDVAPHPVGCQGDGCHALAASALRWTQPLPGYWHAGGGGAGDSGDGSTVPASGQALVAAGGKLAVVGIGLDVTGYDLATGHRRWQVTLAAPPGAVIMSVRAWPDVVTVGLLAPDGRSRTEAVLSARDGRELRRYPAAVYGGAVAASAAATVVIGASAVTSYGNATGQVRWRRAAGGAEPWRVDGQTLYLAESPGGALGSSPVTALRVVDLGTGAERTLSSPIGSPFSGTLALATDGAVLFAAPAGVTAYSGSTGGELWSAAGAVPEGTDPAARLVYLAEAGGTLGGVDPLTGRARAVVPASAVPGDGAVYVVRGGTAFGLDAGASGAAWEYATRAGRVSWTSAGLPWPHFYADVSGLGGSAAEAGGTVVVTACPRLGATAPFCADPELVAFAL